MLSILLRLARTAVAVSLLGFAGCHADTAAQSPPPSDWDEYVKGFLDSYFHNNPTFAVSQGRHEFDGRLPDWSAKGLEAWRDKLHRARNIVSSFTITASDTARQFEREYLAARIDRDLFWLERADWPHRNPEFYSGSLDPNAYLTREYAPLAERMRAFTRYAMSLPAALDQMRANLRTPMPRAYAEIAIGRFGGLASYLKDDVPKVFVSVGDSTLRREFEGANAGAVAALVKTTAWFTSEEKRGTDAYALGLQLFTEMLRMTEGVDDPLDSLEARGHRDMDRNLAALKEACGAYAPGASVAACVDKMNAHKSRLPPVDEARHQLDTLQAFVRAKRLVSVPGNERALVRMSPPYQRFNFAYIDIPGTYEKGLPSIYYIAPSTRYGPGTSSISCIPNGCGRRSVGCSLGTPMPRDGRITRRR
jgi:hypothetical protein